MDCTIYVAKTKALISCIATAQRICSFVFAFAESRFSHDAAQLRMVANPYNRNRKRLDSFKENTHTKH